MRLKKVSLVLLGTLACASVLIWNLQPCAAQTFANQTVDLNNPAVIFGPNDPNLQIHDSMVLVNGESLFSVGGDTGGHVIWFYAPNYGRYIFSTRPHPKFQFREVEVRQNRTIAFESDGNQFEWIMSAPLSTKTTISQLWMMHDKQPESPKDEKTTGGEIGAATHYEYILPAAKQ